MADLLDTLEFWHPVWDQPLDEQHFQWGVAVPGSSADKYFRVRNVSYAYTASAVEISLQEMGVYEPVLSVAAQHYLSTDGSRFTATIEIGDLAPRAISNRLTLRRVTALNADSGDGEFQLLAHAASWL